MTRIAEELIAAGMSPVEAQRKAELLAACESICGNIDRHWFVPGRIEVLGKHTDYAGGRSLLCTAERGMCMAARKRADSGVKIVDAVTGESAEFSIAADIDVPDRGWAIYPTTVARRLARNFPGQWIGADIAFASDLPRASGMSSSSVLVTAVFTALGTLNDLESKPEYSANIKTREDIAGYSGCIENGQTFGMLVGDAGVGTFGGSEDHTAILCCRPGELSQFGFCPIRFEGSVSMPEDCIWVIAVSGVTAPKAGSARESYNNISRAAAMILDIWRRHSGAGAETLAAAIRSSSDAADRIRALLPQTADTGIPPDYFQSRFDQFVLESEKLVPSATRYLAAGDLEGFGRVADDSQAAAESGLRNQVPETIALARTARTLGAHAASAFGAGFGGSVWALVNRNDANEFCDRWRAHYLHEFPERSGACRFFLTGAGPSLMQLR